MPVVQGEVIADPHDLPLEVLVVDDEVRGVGVAVGVNEIAGLVSFGHVIQHPVEGNFGVASDIHA